MILLVPGVGFGPETMASVAALVPGSRAVARPTGSLASRLAALAAVAGDAPWVLAGVSGGATLALAGALAGLPGLVRVVAHEPLVGQHAPTLWSAVQTGRDALATGVQSAEQWFGGLIGRSDQAVMARHDGDLLAEIEPFVTWDPPSLATTVPVRTTVGDRSGPARHEAAGALAAAGAEVEVLPGCGHLAQLDAPAAFAEAILR